MEENTNKGIHVVLGSGSPEYSVKKDFMVQGRPSIVHKPTIYALFDPNGNMVRCGLTLDIATNYFPNDDIRDMDEFPNDMWNALVSANAKMRKSIYKQYGWIVRTGTFEPHPPPMKGIAN